MPWGTTTTHGGTNQRNREDLSRETERRTGNKLDFRQTGDAPPKQSFQKYRKLGGVPLHGNLCEQAKDLYELKRNPSVPSTWPLARVLGRHRARPSRCVCLSVCLSDLYLF